VAASNLTVNVRVRVGLLGKLSIALIRYMPRAVPLAFVVWCVNHSSFMSIGRGRWQRFNPGLSVGDYQ
jgi:hypothetical protein